MPFVYWTIAPGAGQAFRQPGSYAVHAAVLADQPFEVAIRILVSLNRISVHECSLRSCGLS